jgi:hypothetical protein
VLIGASLYRLHGAALLTLRRYCRPPISNRFKDVAKTGRNEPCPCGSGRKYKLCHGAISTPIQLVAAPSPAAEPAAAIQRECGSCTACCEGWAEGEIRGHRMHPGQPCHFLQAGACTIYEERPQSPCRNFVCGWLMPGSPFPEAFRPDRVGVIIVNMRWQGRPAYTLLPAGNDAGPEMLAWMRHFAQASGSPFYYSKAGERLGYGPAAFQQEMLDKLQRGIPLW